MVREITIAPDFTPGFVEVGGKIPKFQYQKSLKKSLPRICVWTYLNVCYSSEI